ncbi:MAG: hypothetical protein HY841_01325 [Bacteroidetes bacterium]|nr:hypothetical protein [Bacteroidota bacterium]
MTEDNTQKIDESVLKEIESRLLKWRIGANLLSVGLILIGFLAVACSVFVSAFIGLVDEGHIRIIAATATVSFTIINAFNLKTMASNVRNGWKNLNAALYKFKSKQITAKDLINKYEESEHMIGTVEFNFNKSKEETYPNIK